MVAGLLRRSPQALEPVALAIISGSATLAHHPAREIASAHPVADVVAISAKPTVTESTAGLVGDTAVVVGEGGGLLSEPWEGQPWRRSGEPRWGDHHRLSRRSRPPRRFRPRLRRQHPVLQLRECMVLLRGRRPRGRRGGGESHRTVPT